MDESTLYSLYVSNLDESVHEGMLYEMFKSMGSVVSLRVVKDENNKSLGYAYVNFSSLEDAEQAITQLNGTEVNGTPCSISHQKRRSGKNTIFVSNLPENTTSEELTEVLSEFGNITSMKIVPSGKRFQGYVEFETEEEMRNAIDASDHIQLRGNDLYVTQFIPRDKREKLKENSWTNVFVKNLPGEITTNELNELFEPYGTITSSTCSSIDVNGDSRSYGYVNFENHEDAVKAVNGLNETTFLGSTIYCTRAEKKSDRKKFLKRSDEGMNFYGRNLFVKNLDPDFTEDDLRSEFGKYGVVTSVKIPVDEYGSKGIGYVCFETKEEALFAVQDKAVNRYVIGCRKPLVVSIHEPRGMREERFLRGEISYVQPSGGQMPSWTGPPSHYQQQPMLLNELATLVGSLHQTQRSEKASPEIRQAIGNIIFPLINQYQPLYATKITGMFLEWPVQQIFEVATNQDILMEAIQSASNLLSHQQ
jgi:polyadenylate-binding protein